MGVYAYVSGNVYLKRGDIELLKQTAKNLELKVYSYSSTEEYEAIVFKTIEEVTWEDCCINVSINQHDSCAHIEYNDDHFSTEKIETVLDWMKPLLLPAPSPDELDIIVEEENADPWGIRIPAPGEYEEVLGAVVYDGIACDRKSCAFEHDGGCQCHKVHGRYPKINNGECSEYLCDPRKKEEKNND